MADDQAVFKHQKLLKCKQDIKEYIGFIAGQRIPITDHEFDSWRTRGMPMRHVNGAGWYAWTDNIHEFLRRWTGVSTQGNIPEDSNERR